MEIHFHGKSLLKKSGHPVLHSLASHSGQLSLLPSAGCGMSNGLHTVAVLFGWEDNNGSGIATVLSGWPTRGLNGPRKGHSSAPCLCQAHLTL